MIKRIHDQTNATLLSIYHQLELKATTHLGGEDFDDVLVDQNLNEFKRKNKADCTKSKRLIYS